MIPVPGFQYEFVPGTAARTLLLLHGTGGNEHDLLGLGRDLDPSANLLSPRGQVLENGMPRFFRRLAEGVFDEKDLRQRTVELAEFIAQAAREHGFDPAKVVAVGYSNGANIAASLLLLRPGALAAAILFRPMVPLVPEALPVLRGVRVHIAAGNLDPIASPAQVGRLAALLRESSAEVDVAFADAGHGLTSGDIDGAKNWLGHLPA